MIAILITPPIERHEPILAGLQPHGALIPAGINVVFIADDRDLLPCAIPSCRVWVYLIAENFQSNCDG